MRTAFKEWAIIVDALARGEQIIILRKGGISEGHGGFQVGHERFLLFPTLYHQQRENVRSAAQTRYDEIAPHFPPADTLHMEHWVEVADWRQLDSLELAGRLRGQHIWREEVIAERFDWGKSRNIFALAGRIFRLPHAVELPMLPAYGGCKSWVELDTDISLDGSQPVLTDTVFTVSLGQFRAALG
jgi:hypothetical protein